MPVDGNGAVAVTLTLVGAVVGDEVGGAGTRARAEAEAVTGARAGDRDRVGAEPVAEPPSAGPGKALASVPSTAVV